ncbi:MAG: glycosyltransferase [Crocinitomicaceae bacterium]
MQENKDYILWLTKWYPNVDDPQLGIFVRKHAELLANKHRVVVIYLCPNWNSSKPKVDYKKNGKLEEYIVYYRPFKRLMKVFNPYMYYRFQKEVYASLEGRPKHCFVNIGAKTGFLPYYHLRKEGISYSLIEHWSGFVNGKFNRKSGYKKRFYKRLVGKAQSVFAVSEYLKKGMEQQLKISGIQIVPNVIEDSVRLGSPSDQPTILVVGDLEDEVKNISGVLRAFKHFVQIRSEYQLKIVGGGSSESDLKKLNKELGLENLVHFLGRLENKKTLQEIASCKFLVSNSNFETFGMVLSEALMAGKPVVSTKSGGPEEFLNIENSILIEKQNEEDLLQAMLQMHEKYDQFDSKKISRSIHERFDRDKILNILETDLPT